MKRYLMMLVGLVLLFGGWWLGWSFQSANLAVIDIDLLWFTIEGVSVWKLVMAAFALGAGLVFLTAAFFYTRGVILRRRYRARGSGPDKPGRLPPSRPMGSFVQTRN